MHSNLKWVFALFLLLFLGSVYAADTKKFLSLTDIHFTPFASCNQTPCALIQNLAKSTPDEWEALLAKYDVAAKYGQDTTYPLLKSSLDEAKKEALDENVQFIIVLGDFLGHDYKKKYADFSGDTSAEGYQAFVKKTFEFLAIEFQQRFPSIDLYNLLGNNDSYIDDYVFDAKGTFFKDLANLWSFLIKNPMNQAAMRASFSNAGYYAVNFPNDDRLRLIVLNSTLFSNRAQGADVTVAARSELDWLKTELDDVHKHSQKALIVMHIPVGMDVYATLKKGSPVELWQPEFTSTFLTLSRNYARDIMAILSAHLHADGFEILNSGSTDEVGNSMVSSISPANGNNPGFKIYSFDQGITDFVTYVDVLDKNSWNTEYDFNDIYQAGCKDCSLLNGMKNIQKTGPTADAYKQLYATGTDSQAITKGKWLPYYWCAIQTITANDYQKCLTAK